MCWHARPMTSSCAAWRRSHERPSSPRPDYSPDEMMTIAAARLLWPGCVCFVGIGTPSAAANLARLTHAPDIVLIYESGTIGTRPSVLPLSIGDGELAATATSVVSLPEVFSYWLQADASNVGFLGAAQIDRFGNLKPPSSATTRSRRRACPGRRRAGNPPSMRSRPSSCSSSRRAVSCRAGFRDQRRFLGGHGERARSGHARRRP